MTIMSQAGKYTYTREIHFMNKLRKMNGLSRSAVPEHIIEKVREALLKENIQNPTRNDIRSILRSLKALNYYDETQTILEQVGTHTPVVETSPEECPICFEVVTSMVRLDCKHLFCEECIKKLNNDQGVKCPLCRRNQTVQLRYRLTQEQMDELLTEYTLIKEDLPRNYSFDKVIEGLLKKRGWKII